MLEVTVILVLVFHCYIASATCDVNNCTACVVDERCRWCLRDKQCRLKYSTENDCSESIQDEERCGDSLGQYDPSLSLKMLRLSAVAYDQIHPQQCLDSLLPESGISIKKIATAKCDASHNCSAYIAVAEKEKAIVLVFRGTTKRSQVLNQATEIFRKDKVEFIKGKVQQYWKSGFDKLWACMGDAVRSFSKDYPSYKIWVTGHSLGGALASLASVQISHDGTVPRKDIITYTFGMPRVGNRDYAVFHDQMVNNSFRVVNFNDIVPHLPTTLGITVISGDENQPYHHGLEVFYKTAAESPQTHHVICPYNEDPGCSNGVVPNPFSNHKYYFSIRVGTYCKQMRRRRRRHLGVADDEDSPFLFLENTCSMYDYNRIADFYASVVAGSTARITVYTATTAIVSTVITIFNICS